MVAVAFNFSPIATRRTVAGVEDQVSVITLAGRDIDGSISG
jgi:hypothetical protein